MKYNILSKVLVALSSLGLYSVASADVYTLPAGEVDLIGGVEIIHADGEPTLADVARNHNLGHEEIRIANPTVDFWLLPPGQKVVLPKLHILPSARREGIVLNVPEMRLYYFPKACAADKECEVATYPVAIGRMDWKTPLGTARVTSKVADPAWRPPKSIREEAAADGRPLPAVVPPGPDNPMGAYALYLNLPGYRIHGTNRPYGVGMRATHGCVRMYPEDIEVMFKEVPVGTPVQIVSQPVKFGWEGDTLYMEVHPPLEEDIESDAHLEDMAIDQLSQLALERPFMMDNTEFQRALFERKGVPVPITLRAEARRNEARRTEARKTDVK
jgi:L,D-transpeptidase ErfK/SrfK